MTLRRRLSNILLALALVPTLVVMAAAYLEMRHFAAEEAAQDMEDRAVLAAKHIDELVDTFASDLRVLSLSPAFYLAPPATLERMLQDSLRYRPMVSRLELVDGRGVIVATTAPQEKGRRVAELQPHLTALLREALAASPDAVFVGASADSEFHALSGINDRAGKSSAVLIATLRREYLLRRVMDLDGPPGSRQFAYLIDRDGHILLTGNPRVRADAVHPLAGALAAQGASHGSLESVSALPGTAAGAPEQTLSGYARIGPFGDNDFADWILVTSSPTRLLLAPMRRLFDTVAYFLLGLAVVTIVIGLRLARTLTQPLEELAGLAGRFGAGDLAVRARTATGTQELDVVAGSFNEMAVRVASRTDDLARANADLKVLGERNELARAVIESSAEAVMVTDAGLLIESVNPAFERITGFTAAEAIGHKPSILFSGKHDDAFFHRLHDRVDEQGRWRGEIWNRRRNGEIYPQQTSINVLRDAQGRITHYASVFMDNTAQNQLEAKLREMSLADGLTGIGNRRMFDETLAREWARALRDGSNLSLLMADIDFFKHYNDEYGHLRGDACLQHVAKAIQQAASRASDVVARYGGEEFAVILPTSDATAAAAMGERIRAAVAALALPHGKSDATAFVTISVGAATRKPQVASAQVELIAAADRALYQAKHGGRNRVVPVTDERPVDGPGGAPAHAVSDAPDSAVAGLAP